MPKVTMVEAVKVSAESASWISGDVFTYIEFVFKDGKHSKKVYSYEQAEFMPDVDMETISEVNTGEHPRSASFLKTPRGARSTRVETNYHERNCMISYWLAKSRTQANLRRRQSAVK